MIKIETEKVISTKFTGPGRKILGMEALGWDSLPHEYKNGYPRCYFESEVLNASGGNCGSYLRIGDVLTEKNFQKALDLLHECGKRLKKINEENQKLAETWQGTETFII